MGMMPWRDQARILLRWTVWDLQAPLWVNIVLRIAQVILVTGFARGAPWVIAAGIALILAGAVTETALKNKDTNRRQ